MEEVKKSFERVKRDISFLHQEMFGLKKDLEFLNSALLTFGNLIKEKVFNEPEKSSHNKERFSLNDISIKNISSTDKDKNQTNKEISSTDKFIFKPLNDQILGISTGNQGVQTDRQTDRQTDKSRGNTLNNAYEALESLEILKKELKTKLNKLTDQELLVFTTIYQLQEQGIKVNYKTLSKKLSLTESSIRDYIKRLIFKEIPLEKQKENNKEIFLLIPSNLRKLATINTILQLRETKY